MIVLNNRRYVKLPIFAGMGRAAFCGIGMHSLKLSPIAAGKPMTGTAAPAIAMWLKWVDGGRNLAARL